MAGSVGLDIATSAVRAVELDVGARPPELMRFGQVGLTPGSVVEGEVHDVAAVATALRRLWDNGDFGTKRVTIGAAGTRAITRELDIPYVPDDEVDAAARFQSEEVIPFPPDRTVLQAQVLADYTTPDGNRMRRLLVGAVHRDVIDRLVDAVDQAGLEVVGIDLVSSALVRSMLDLAYPTDHAEAVVSVGAGLTLVVIHQRGVPQLVRTVTLGGNTITQAVSGALDVPFADAEAIKRRFGEPLPQMEAAERAAQAAIAEVVGEIRNSLQFYASLPGRPPVFRLLLTGGGARTRGLVERLQAEARVPVYPVSTLARLNAAGLALSPEQALQIDPVVAVPVGLALPEPGPGAKKFNLVPPEVIERQAERRIRRNAIAVGALVVVLLVALSVLRFLQVHNTEHSIASLKAEIASDQQTLLALSPVAQATHVIQQATAQVDRITSGAVDWPVVFDELGRRTPPGVQVTSLQGTANQVPGAQGQPGVPAPASTPAPAPASGGQAQEGIGQLSVTCSAAGSTFQPATAWIDGLSASPLFYPPVVPGVNVQNGTVTFQSTVGVTSAASLAHDPAYS
jgi:type IV pilus assembly protein PilM